MRVGNANSSPGMDASSRRIVASCELVSLHVRAYYLPSLAFVYIKMIVTRLRTLLWCGPSADAQGPPPLAK